MKKLFFVLSFLALAGSVLRCATIINQRVGYVDMNRVIEASPETKEIKDELMADLKTMKGNIKIFQDRIDALEKEIKTMEDEMSKYEQSKNQQPAVPPSAPSPAVSAAIGVPSPTTLSSSPSPAVNSAVSAPSPSAFPTPSSPAVSAATSAHSPAGFPTQSSPMTNQEVFGSSVTHAVPGAFASPPFNTPVSISSVMPQGAFASVPGSVQISSTAQQGTVAVSSPSFTYADIEAKKDLLAKQKLDLEEYKSSAETTEKNMNKKIKKNLLGKIYDSIKDVSEEEGLTIVLDSSNVLYDESMTDITDKVIDKLKQK